MNRPTPYFVIVLACLLAIAVVGTTLLLGTL
jgi:hypothetical protein